MRASLATPMWGALLCGLMSLVVGAASQGVDVAAAIADIKTAVSTQAAPTFCSSGTDADCGVATDGVARYCCTIGRATKGLCAVDTKGTEETPTCRRTVGIGAACDNDQMCRVGECKDRVIAGDIITGWKVCLPGGSGKSCDADGDCQSNLCQKESGAAVGKCTNKFCPLAADGCDSGRECSPRAGNVGACLLINNADSCPTGSIIATNRACASGRGCNGTANAARCLPCTSKTCTGNFECDSQSKVCECKAGRNCCSRDAHCQGPATCVLPSQSCGGRGTCLLNVGNTCSKDWQCGARVCAGGKCECDKKSKQCRIKAGRRCTPESNECLTDLTCGTRAGEGTSRCLLPLGAKRCDWRQQCAGTTAGDTFCDTSEDGDRACLLKVNSKCLYNQGKSYCGDGTRCYKDGVVPAEPAELCGESDLSCTCKCPQEKSCCNVAAHCAVPGPAVVGAVVCKGGTCDTA